jgi:hypothetical protein
VFAAAAEQVGAQIMIKCGFVDHRIARASERALALLRRLLRSCGKLTPLPRREGRFEEEQNNESSPQAPHRFVPTQVNICDYL